MAGTLNAVQIYKTQKLNIGQILSKQSHASGKTLNLRAPGLLNVVAVQMVQSTSGASATQAICVRQPTVPCTMN